MSQTGLYAITYTGGEVIRLPRAGIFQTGTRAVVDETIARIAVALRCFAVEPLDDAVALVQAVPLAVAPEATPAPVAAISPAAQEKPQPRRTQRRSAVLRVP